MNAGIDHLKGKNLHFWYLFACVWNKRVTIYTSIFLKGLSFADSMFEYT